MPDSLLKLVSYKWQFINSNTNDTTIIDVSDTTQRKELFAYGYKMYLRGDINRVCVLYPYVDAYYSRPSIIPSPKPLSIFILADSLSKPLYDSLGTNSLGRLDSTKKYLGFCKGSSIRLTAIPNQNGPASPHAWKHANGTFITHDTSFIYTTGKAGVDTLLYSDTSNIKCLVDPDITDTIFISVVDSVDVPRITISGLKSVCTGIIDTFTATLTPHQIADTSAQYRLVWYVNGAAKYVDPVTYTDTSSTPMQFIDNITNLTDSSITATLLTSKTFSCAYAPDSLFKLPPSLDITPGDTLALRSFSDTITLGVTTTITPTIHLSASQTTLCPDSILQRLGVKDTVLFTAVSDTISAKTGLYTWLINGVPVKDSSLLTFNATNDTTTFISNGLIKDNDVVSVILVTSFKCVTSDSASDSLLMIPKIPIFNPTLSVLSFCSAGLQDNYPFAPQNDQNKGSKPTYVWTLNNKYASDSSTYVYSPIHDKDTVALKFTSSIACAQPKDTLFVVPIVVTTALVPRDSISAPVLTTCSNDPNNPNANPLIINTYPTNGGSKPSYTCYLVGSGGPGTDIALGNDTIIYLTNLSDTQQVQKVYCTMTSNESCVFPTSINSVDTIPFIVNPLPHVDPIQGNPSVCTGATTTLIDATPGGLWYSFSPSSFYASVESGVVTGLNAGCSKRETFSITVNPSTVPFDVLLYKTICAGQSDTIYNSYYTSTIPDGVFTSSDPTIATVTTGLDANQIPIAIVTPVGNGMVVIKDSINTNECGTSLRYDTIFVGVPVIGPIQGSNTICTIGGTSQLSVKVTGDTAFNWSSSDNSIISVDPVTGLVTANGSGQATITYNAYNNCTQGNPVTQSIVINVGRPTITGSISGGTSPICTFSSSQPFHSFRWLLGK